MRTKKSFRKNKSETKEDNENYREQNETLMKMENNLNTVSSNLLHAHDEKMEAPNLNNNNSRVQENESKQKEVDDNLILSDISNKNDEIEILNLENINKTGLQVCHGEKRPMEEPSVSVEVDDSQTILNQFKKKCLEFEERIKTIEDKWTTCPKTLSMSSNIFLNNALNGIDQENIDMNNNDEMLKAMEILNIDTNSLLKLKKRTATATARSILKYKFPTPAANFKLTDMDKTLIDAIVLYSQQSNPNDKSTKSKIRKAMSNYFSLIMYNRKFKLVMPNTNIEEESKKFYPDE